MKFKGSMLDLVLRKIDKNISKFINLTNENKISHAIDNTSNNHKDTICELKGIPPSMDMKPIKDTKPVIENKESIKNTYITNNVINYIKLPTYKYVFKPDSKKKDESVEPGEKSVLSSLLSLFPKEANDDYIYALIKLTADGELVESTPYILKEYNGDVLIGLVEGLVE